MKDDRLIAWSRLLAATAMDVDGHATRATTPGQPEELHQIALRLRSLATEVRGQYVDPDARDVRCLLCNSATQFNQLLTINEDEAMCSFTCFGPFHHNFTTKIPAEDAVKLQSLKEWADVK